MAAALGCLPLALSHAAAYCQTGTTFTEYLAMLTDLPASIVFDSSPQAFYAQTVASTWRPSIAAATNDAPLAEHVLAVAAHLAPDAIPKALFVGVLDDPDDPTHANVSATHSTRCTASASSPPRTARSACIASFR